MALEHRPLYITASVGVRSDALSVNGQKRPLRPSHPSGDFFQFLYEAWAIDYPKYFKMDALCKLGIAATHLLLKDFDATGYRPEELGIVLSNNGGSIEADINYYESSKTYPSPSLFVYTLPNIVIGEISIRYGFKGENAFFIHENFDPQWIQFYVAQLFQEQGLRACICGWIEVKDAQYDARLFLIEQEKKNGITFTADHLHTTIGERR